MLKITNSIGILSRTNGAFQLVAIDTANKTCMIYNGTEKIINWTTAASYRLANSEKTRTLTPKLLISMSLQGKEVRVESYKCAVAVGEYLAGSAKGCSSAVVVTLGASLGVGAILNGRVFDAPIIDAAECGLLTERHNKAANEMFLHAGEHTMEEIMYLLKEAAHRFAGTRMEEICIDYMAGKIFGIISTLHPEVLSIGGRLFQNGSLLDSIKERVQKAFKAEEDGPGTEVRVCALGAAGGVVGAAMLCRVERFSPAKVFA